MITSRAVARQRRKQLQMPLFRLHARTASGIKDMAQT
jgi:hypothetical protein